MEKKQTHIAAHKLQDSNSGNLLCQLSSEQVCLKCYSFYVPINKTKVESCRVQAVGLSMYIVDLVLANLLHHFLIRIFMYFIYFLRQVRNNFNSIVSNIGHLCRFIHGSQTQQPASKPQQSCCSMIQCKVKANRSINDDNTRFGETTQSASSAL